MKRNLIMLVAFVIGSFSFASAQGGGFPQRTTAERVASVNEKLAEFKLSAENQKKSDAAFTAYYDAQTKIREEMMAGGQPDFQAMREKMEPLTAELDGKLKTIFTDDQFKKWKDEIEPSLRPRRQ